MAEGYWHVFVSRSLRPALLLAYPPVISVSRSDLHFFDCHVVRLESCILVLILICVRPLICTLGEALCNKLPFLRLSLESLLSDVHPFRCHAFGSLARFVLSLALDSMRAGLDDDSPMCLPLIDVNLYSLYALSRSISSFLDQLPRRGREEAPASMLSGFLSLESSSLLAVPGARAPEAGARARKRAGPPAARSGVSVLCIQVALPGISVKRTALRGGGTLRKTGTCIGTAWSLRRGRCRPCTMSC